MNIRDIFKRMRYPESDGNQMVEGESAQSIASKDDLENFFADLTGDYRLAEYEGFFFETEYRGTPSVLLALLFTSWYGIISRLTCRKPRGIYVSIHLPQRLNIDLHLESREWRPGRKEVFDQYFHVQATNGDDFDNYCTPEFRALLMKLYAHYTLMMDDTTVIIGPFLQTPVESADALDLLIKTIPQSTDSVMPAPNYFAAANKEGVAKIIRLASTTLEADLIHSALSGAGIPCSFVGYEQSRVWGNTPGLMIKILVPESYAEQAETILSYNLLDDPEGHGEEGFQ